MAMTPPFRISIAFALALSMTAFAQQAQGQRPPGRSVVTFVDYMAPPDSLEALTSQVSLIVRGRPHSPKPVTVGSLVGTEYRVTLKEVIKGDQSQRSLAEITLVELGGDPVDGRGVPTRAELPVRLRPDAESVFFLTNWPAAQSHSIASGGAFPIEDDNVVIPNAVRHMKAFGGQDRIRLAEFVALVTKAKGQTNQVTTPMNSTFSPELPLS
jgi:hypothetical protein